MTDVIFLTATDNVSKLRHIEQMVTKHYMASDRLLIFAPDAQAAAFLDKYLWQSPEESFLPHAIINTPTNEQIAITIGTANVNEAPYAFNICPEAPLHWHTFTRIYELLDKTHPSKLERAEQRLQFYKNNGAKLSLI